jgi:WD40 repeat protein
MEDKISVEILHQIHAPGKLPVLSADINMDNSLVALGQEFTRMDPENTTLSLIDVQTGKVTEILEKYTEETLSVHKVRFSPISQLLAYVLQTAQTFQLKIYDLKSKKITIGHETSSLNMIGLTFTNDGKYLVVPGKEITIFDISDFENKRTINLPNNDAVMKDNPNATVNIAISPNNKYIAIGNIELGKILIYDFEKGEHLKNIEGEFRSVFQIEFNNTGNIIAVILSAVGAYGRALFLWDIEKEERVLPDVFDENFSSNLCIGFNPVKDYLAQGTTNQSIYVYELEEGDEIYSDELHARRVWDLRFSRDGKFLITGGELNLVVVRKIEYL